jgi:hypothetical protein
MGRAQTIAMVATPLVAMATLAVGLRIGAGNAVHAALVYGAPPARGSTVRAWQVVSVLEDRGVRESVPLKALTVRATAPATGDAPARAREAEWNGDTNVDGVAEIRLDMPWLRDGEPVTLVVTSAADPAPLARGSVAWATEAWASNPPAAFVRPSKRDGDVALDLAIQGGALTPGFPTSTWIRATDAASGAPLPGVTIDVEPEPGLTVTSPTTTTCAEGWAEISAQPIIHVVGLSLHAHAAGGKSGDWYGSPPVAPGASYVALPPTLDGREAHAFDVIAPTAREVAYVEVDDAEGRAVAAALALETQPGGLPHARFEVPPLAGGLHWLVTSGEPRGADSLRGAALARPFWVEPGVGARAEPAPRGACALGAHLATHPAAAFHRWLALDGFKGREDANAKSHRIGLGLAMGSLVVAAVLELLLILSGTQRTRDDLQRAARDLDDRGAGASMTTRTSTGSIAIGVLIALLGFGLLASLLMWRAG